MERQRRSCRRRQGRANLGTYNGDTRRRWRTGLHKPLPYSNARQEPERRNSKLQVLSRLSSSSPGTRLQYLQSTKRHRLRIARHSPQTTQELQETQARNEKRREAQCVRSTPVCFKMDFSLLVRLSWI